MIHVLFTLDYEIHGNGYGSPLRLMVLPTQRLLRLFDRYGARLTIMADVAEIFKFGEYARDTGQDAFHHADIENQLKEAVRRGHDVQLHIHPSYYRARHEQGHWEQHWEDYDLARLGRERLSTLVREGKGYLERLLQPCSSRYACTAFRAANWSLLPSPDIVAALLDNDIRIDTSIFKYGKRSGLVSFDYASAYSEFLPWPVDTADARRMSPDGRLLEIPIACELRSVWTFVTLNRLFRVAQGWMNPVKQVSGAAPVASPTAAPGLRQRLSATFARLTRVLGQPQAWKLDFNQCSGKQLIRALQRIEAKAAGLPFDLPVVLIGHSKTFTAVNALSLRPFLRYVAGHPHRYAFATLGDVNAQEIIQACRQQHIQD